LQLIQLLNRELLQTDTKQGISLPIFVSLFLFIHA